MTMVANNAGERIHEVFVGDLPVFGPSADVLDGFASEKSHEEVMDHLRRGIGHVVTAEALLPDSDHQALI